LEDNPKASLRKMLLEKRDNTSFDLMNIASNQIRHKLGKIESFRDAHKVGAYYPIGSEILTQDIIQDMISRGKQVYLPRMIGQEIEFRRITDFSSLEKGKFDLMEPRQECPRDNNLDVILVPTVGISPKGVRLGYGHGFYDRFLSRHKTVSISLALEKQMVKTIPKSEHDTLIDWIVTEDRVLETSKVG
jgi:5-formyltetrahydrofolate cyclo-ligase